MGWASDGAGVVVSDFSVRVFAANKVRLASKRIVCFKIQASTSHLIDRTPRGACLGTTLAEDIPIATARISYWQCTACHASDSRLK